MNDHSNESCWAEISCGIVYCAVYKMIPIFKNMDDTRVRHQSNESYWAVPSYGTVYSAMQGRCRWKRAVKDGSNVFFFVDMKRWKLNRQFCASYD